jgi:hypothetical protein
MALGFAANCAWMDLIANAPPTMSTANPLQSPRVSMTEPCVHQCTKTRRHRLRGIKPRSPAILAMNVVVSDFVSYVGKRRDSRLEIGYASPDLLLNSIANIMVLTEELLGVLATLP